MNDRLEIASRLMAAVRAAGHSMPTADALWEADALIEAEARTRPPAADELMPIRDDMRAVAEELVALAVLQKQTIREGAIPINCDIQLGMTWEDGYSKTGFVIHAIDTALSRARALGLGGGK